MSGNHVMGEVWASADSRTVALFEVHPRGTNQRRRGTRPLAAHCDLDAGGTLCRDFGGC